MSGDHGGTRYLTTPQISILAARRHCDPSGHRGELVGPRAEVDLVRRLVIEGLMQPPAIVGVEVRRELPLRFAAVTIRVQIDFLVLDRSPQPLDEYVVHPATFAVHADATAGGLQPIEPVPGSELRALVAVENLRGPEARERLVGRLGSFGQISGWDKWTTLLS